MASPPFTPDESLPQPTDLISQYPTQSQTYRDIMESWMLINHDTDGEHFRIDFPEQASGDTLTPLAGSQLMFATSSAVWVKENDAGATGAGLALYHASASPAAGDDIGTIHFVGKDSAAALNTYAKIFAEIDDTTNGSEDSAILFQPQVAGTLTTMLELNASGATFGSGATFAGSIDVASASVPTLVLERTGSTINANIQFETSGSSVYAGHGAASTFAVGGSSNLTSSPWLELTSSAATFAGSGTFGTTLAVGTTITAQNLVLTAVSAGGIGNINQDTSDGADTKAIGIGGGGSVSNARGARILMYGNEHASFPGLLSLSSGAGAGTIQLLTPSEFSSTVSIAGTLTGAAANFSGSLTAGTSNLGATTVASLTSSASLSATGGTFTSLVTGSRFSASSTGSSTTVAFSSGSDTNTGLYFPSENVMRVAVGGADSAEFTLSSISLNENTTITGTLDATGIATAERLVTTSGVIAQDSAGDMWLRPGGPSSTSGQVHIASSGNTTINGTLTVTG